MLGGMSRSEALMSTLSLPALVALIALILGLAAAPAAAGGPKPPHQASPLPCVPAVIARPHPRSSDMPMRGERVVPICTDRRPGPLHHFFHGHRR
jgi:hypothetical protein